MVAIIQPMKILCCNFYSRQAPGFLATASKLYRWQLSESDLIKQSPVGADVDDVELVLARSGAGLTSQRWTAAVRFAVRGDDQTWNMANLILGPGRYTWINLAIEDSNRGTVSNSFLLAIGIGKISSRQSAWDVHEHNRVPPVWWLRLDPVHSSLSSIAYRTNTNSNRSSQAVSHPRTDAA